MKTKSGRLGLAIIVFVAVFSVRSDAAGHPQTSLPSQNPMSLEQNRTKNEADIRRLIERVVEAICAKDLNGVMAVFSPDVVSFDLGPPLQHGGGDAFRTRWQELFDAYQDPIHYELRDLSITVSDDVAFSHSLNRISGTLKNGQPSELWLRWTAGYRKTNGRWQIVHEQVSVPVDVRSGKAMLDLAP